MHAESSVRRESHDGRMDPRLRLQTKSTRKISSAGTTRDAPTRSTTPSDGFYCTEGHCTHEDEHLEAGLLTGHVIECPLHQGRFDIRSGEVLSPPPCIDLNTYPVKTEDGQVYVRV